MMRRESLFQKDGPNPRDLMVFARRGSAAALGQLLEHCRDYLLFVANQGLDDDLRAVVAPSDLVQETFVQAQQRFGSFRGTSEAELVAWLRAILLNREFAAYRRYRTAAKRRIPRDPAENGASLSPDAAQQAVCDLPSPSAVASLLEQNALLERALRQLPPDYERVVRMRYWEELTFAEIGQQMRRSSEAARKLWFRAVELLGEILESGDESSQ
jgi:RNA polymerase sigma-70 factor (ECF subfamily)